jgi:hypothetical protein
LAEHDGRVYFEAGSPLGVGLKRSVASIRTTDGKPIQLGNPRGYFNPMGTIDVRTVQDCLAASFLAIESEDKERGLTIYRLSLDGLKAGHNRSPVLIAIAN